MSTDDLEQNLYAFHVANQYNTEYTRVQPCTGNRKDTHRMGLNSDRTSVVRAVRSMEPNNDRWIGRYAFCTYTCTCTCMYIRTYVCTFREAIRKSNMKRRWKRSPRFILNPLTLAALCRERFNVFNDRGKSFEEEGGSLNTPRTRRVRSPVEYSSDRKFIVRSLMLIDWEFWNLIFGIIYTSYM